MKYNNSQGFDYTPPKSLLPFFHSNNPMRFIRGPIGSAKTTATIMELIRRASEQKPGPDNIRRSRCAVVRNTLQQLTSTFLVSWMQLLWPVSNWKVSEKTIQVRLNDIHLDVLLIPLDSEFNINRLLSLELTFGIAAEFRELSLEVVQNLFSRCGRFPSDAAGGCTWFGLWGESNSFTQDSNWYPFLELEKPKNVFYLIQPGATDSNADWHQWLPQNYYHNFIENNPEEWIEQYVHNKIGPSLSGQAVFKTNFHTPSHVRKELKPVPHNLICIGLDTGRNPAAILTQINHKGQLLVLGETFDHNSGIERFVYLKLNPLLQSQRFAQNPVYLVVDPAGKQKSQIGEESVIKALQRLGFPTVTAQTNLIEPRLRAVDKRLAAFSQGEPNILFDQTHAPNIIQAMQAKYRYKIKRDGEFEPKPEKSHPWSDIADALQYACLGSNSQIQSIAIRQTQKYKQNTIQPPPSAGWT